METQFDKIQIDVTGPQISKINGECIIKPQFSPFIYKPKSRSVAL